MYAGTPGLCSQRPKIAGNSEDERKKHHQQRLAHIRWLHEVGLRACIEEISYMELGMIGSGRMNSAALFDRFSSRGEADFADKVLSTARYRFGGHDEKATAAQGGAS